LENPNKTKQNIAGAIVAVCLTVVTFIVTDFQKITVAANSAYNSATNLVSADSPITPANK
jgi:hypothetical protein